MNVAILVSIISEQSSRQPLVKNEKPRKESGGEWDEDAAFGVWSEER